MLSCQLGLVMELHSSEFFIRCVQCLLRLLQSFRVRMISNLAGFSWLSGGSVFCSGGSEMAVLNKCELKHFCISRWYQTCKMLRSYSDMYESFFSHVA